MADRIAELANAARKLTPAERVTLAEVILHDIDGTQESVDQEWLQELHRRLAAAKAGDIATFDADAVIAELRRK